MKENNPEALSNIPAEDQKQMDRLSREAESILAAAEAAPQESVLEESKNILTDEAQKDIALVEEVATKLFNNQEFIKELFLEFQEKYGWHEGKSRAMLNVLRHALNEVYYRSRLTAVDEHNPHPEGETRDTRDILFSVAAEDYGAEAAREALPLIDYYVKEADNLVNV